MSDDQQKQPSNDSWKDEFPDYDWGDKKEAHPLQASQQKLSFSYDDDSKQNQSPSGIASLRPHVRKLKKEDVVKKGSELTLTNVSPYNIAAYTLVKNPFLTASLFGMFSSYGALFHCLAARAPARNTWYWGKYDDLMIYKHKREEELTTD